MRPASTCAGVLLLLPTFDDPNYVRPITIPRDLTIPIPFTAETLCSPFNTYLFRQRRRWWVGGMHRGTSLIRYQNHRTGLKGRQHRPTQQMEKSKIL